MPCTVDDGSQVADWVGTPREGLVLVDPARLADRLQDLAPSFHEPVTT
ncbi:hypothetical protein G5C60_34420 [Streptomyces sp. HC44]|uniref:Uncharacterized protein n=1 Tax=Streptomyces scabichelini TaxID=2711217 RepID=A0A6G4VF24_9ACTN|nr:hypothetical protein [Streptomyces scabichelini]NGO12571.1 hypothetical protein [Streptomyces scabichelini]